MRLGKASMLLSVINVQKKKSLQEFGFIPCGKVLHSICS
jgi:hypothetical protein